MRITLLSLVLCVALSIVLALAVSDADNALVRFDQNAIETLHGHTSPVLNDIFKGVTWFGSPGLRLIGVCAGAFLIWRQRWGDLFTGLVVAGGGQYLNTFVKELIARPRPVWDDPIVSEHTFAFPSGHAMESLLVYGFLTLVLCPALSRRQARAAFAIGAASLIGLIGFSRVFLGVHYPSDVLGGYTIGGAWLSLCVTARTAAEHAALSRSARAEERPFSETEERNS
jgi:membrane-associated phospholipid phosphatase